MFIDFKDSMKKKSIDKRIDGYPIKLEEFSIIYF
jgi:hypothetical protein